MPELASARLSFTQEGDSFEGGIQQLDIEAMDAGAGFFYVLSTERWAVNRPEDLAVLLERVRAIVEPAT